MTTTAIFPSRVFSPTYDQIVDVMQRDSWVTREKVQKVAYLFFASVLCLGGLSLAGAAVGGVIPVWNLLVGLVALRFAMDAYIKSDAFDGKMNVEAKMALQAEAPNLTFKQLESRVRLVDLLHYNILSKEMIQQKLLSAMMSAPLDGEWIRKDDVTREPRAQEFLDQGLIDRPLYNILTSTTRDTPTARATATNDIKTHVQRYAQQTQVNVG